MIDNNGDGGVYGVGGQSPSDPINSSVPVASADVKSNNPQRVLKMLCKHWSHRFEIVNKHEGHALINLGERGIAEFVITGDTLHTTARHPNADNLPALKTAIENHLQRFAKDETLVFAWR